MGTVNYPLADNARRDSCAHAPNPNPRVAECVKCGRPLPTDRDRNVPLERELIDMVARSAGIVEDVSRFSDFRDRRAHPGGVRHDIDADREALEELADCASYLCWGIEPLWSAYQAGDREASKQVAKRLTALRAVVTAWAALSR